MGSTNPTDIQRETDLQPAGDIPIPEIHTNGAGGTHAMDAEHAAPPGGRPRRHRWLVWLAFFALLALAYVAYQRFFVSKPAPAVAPPPAAITVGQSKTGDINIYIQALGTVTPIYTITVFSQITGRVIGVYYREGQMVKKGDALVDIDPQPYLASLAQAQGVLDHDKAVLAQARIDLARYQAAWARNAIARQQLEDQEQLVVQAEASVRADQATVDFAKTQLSYCHIAAPITGRVGLRLVDPGNTIFAGTGSTLVVITQLQPITVVFTVAEDDVTRVQEQLRGGGRLLPVGAYDRSNEHQVDSGKLRSLDNQIDTTTGTVKFRADFPNAHLTLFPNQFVNARLLLKTLRRTVLIPTGAVQHNGTQAFVYEVNANNTVSVQNVQVLTSNEKETAVTGIKAGVKLATSAFDRLENGVQVAVHNPESKK
jgi:multidrug efflux system membrane fusion protein